MRNKIREFNAAMKIARSNGNVSNSALKPRIASSSSSLLFSGSFWRLVVELSMLKQNRAHSSTADSELLIAIVTNVDKAFKLKSVDMRHQMCCRDKVYLSSGKNSSMNKTKN